MTSWTAAVARRNLAPFQRCALALVLKPLIAAQAKERQKRKPVDSVRPNLAKQNDWSRDELSVLAGVSHGTMDKADGDAVQS